MVLKQTLFSSKRDEIQDGCQRKPCISAWRMENSSNHKELLFQVQSKIETAEEEIAEEDMEALEAETNLQDLRLEVYNDLRKPEHPIEVEGYNVCQLTQKNKLMSLKVNYLKTICDTIVLTIEGPQTRKKSYVKPLEELVKSCTCNN